MSITVAIDGPAASGKGTIARAIAARFGMAHLDTGLLYRAVGARTLTGVPAVEAARTLRHDQIDGAALRTPEIAQAASDVAAIPEVRAALVAFQRDFARQPQGAVIDGRDIGTVICPDAAVKLFVTASPEVRAERRFLELAQKGLAEDRAAVLADVRRRDEKDMTRSNSPLRPADDALRLDTSDMTVEAAVAAACDVVAEALAR